MDDNIAPVIAGLAVGIAFVIAFATISPSLSILYSGEQMTITGEVACLPHKKIIGPLGMSFETAECAIGFRGQDGRHYGFDALFFDEKHNWLMNAQGSGELFNITGTISPPEKDHDRYDVAGVIDINSVVRADGTTSIYEVYGRHYSQLSWIIEENGRRTGEYGLSIDEGCDDLGQTSKGGKDSCILIALDKEVPELSSQIPRSIGGYQVHVRILQDAGD